MWSGFQSSQEPLLRRGRKNLRPRGEFEQQLFENFKVQLGIDVVQKKERGLIKTTPEEDQFREFQKEDDHLLFTARQDLGPLQFRLAAAVTPLRRRAVKR